MKRCYEVLYEVGQRVTYDYSGMPEGSPGKSGAGKISAAIIYQWRESFVILYDIEVDGSPYLVQEVNQNFIRAETVCMAV